MEVYAEEATSKVAISDLQDFWTKDAVSDVFLSVSKSLTYIPPCSKD